MIDIKIEPQLSPDEDDICDHCLLMNRDPLIAAGEEYGIVFVGDKLRLTLCELHIATLQQKLGDNLSFDTFL